MTDTITGHRRKYLYGLLILLLLSVFGKIQGADGIAGYLFAHMLKQDYGRLYYSVSTDGLNWRLLNQGKRVNREYKGHPDITRGHDGRFYMTGGSSRITLWVSDNLVTWKKLRDIEPDVYGMSDFKPQEKTYGAAKIYYDQKTSQYLISWHTSQHRKLKEKPEHYWAGQRTLYVLSRDLKTFTPPRRLFQYDMATIDVIVRRTGDGWHAIIKDELYPSPEWKTGKTIRLTSSRSLTGPWTPPSPPISANFREAPTLIPRSGGDGWYLYFEQYPGIRYDCITAKTLPGPWRPLPTKDYKTPPQCRHGCMIAIGKTQFDALLAAYDPVQYVPPRVADIARKDLYIRDPFIVPDPDTQTYYLYKSSHVTLKAGGSRPAVVAYKSKDLETWRGPHPVFYYPDGLWAENRIWAPEVHKYKGKYYLFATFNSSKPVPLAEGRPKSGLRATQICVSDSAMGPFRIFDNKPHTPADWLSLDGTLWEEEGVPYMIFCHEWVQITDGTMEAVRLAPDLSKPVGKPWTLFKASDAPWAKSLSGNRGHVTDGCFLYRTKTGRLLMIWSSFGDHGYTVGIARSRSDKLKGPWEQVKAPLVAQDGGHGMLFKTFDGRLMMPIHHPNSGAIRMRLFELEDCGDTLRLKRN